SGTSTTAGTYSVTISATNAGGTGSATLTLTVVNPPPPVITSATTASGTVGVAFSYQITATNNPTSFNATGLPAGLTVNTSTGLISGTPTTARTYSVTISATNSGGTASATLTLTVVNPPPPIITSATTSTGQVGVAFSYQITATNNPTSYNATGLPAGLTVNTTTGLISGTPTTAGTYTVTISATNSGGTGSATLTLTINPAAPVITSPLTATGQVGVAFSYQITATNSPTSYNVTGLLPAGLSVNTSTGLISGTPTTAGTYTVTISATNAGGTGSATLTLTINNPVPTITSISPTSTTAGSAQFTLTVNGTKFVSTSTVNWNGAPLATSFVSSTQLTAMVPAPLVATAGTASITVVNPNPGGGTSNVQMFTISATPVITSPLTATGQIGVAFSYTITATSNPTSYDADGLPGGLSVDPTTGLISGTPTGVGAFSVTIYATNVAGTGSEALALTISLPSGALVPPFPGELNVFDTGLANDPSTDPNFTIPFPYTTTDNYFQLFWNLPGPKKQNDRVADLPNGGLQRNTDTVGMRFNPYNPADPNSKPDPTKNVWRGNPSPPNDNNSGQFGDPRASWYITDPWPTADYVTSTYWGGPGPQIVPLNWPDSGHRFSQLGVQPSIAGTYPDALAKTAPTPDPRQFISSLSISNSGSLASITELGNVWDPAQLSYSVTNPGDALPD